MIITLPGDMLSRSQYRMGAKAWIKQLDSVDTSKADGYAFTGTVKTWAEKLECDHGTWFMAVSHDRTGSGGPRDTDIILYRADLAATGTGGLVTVRTWEFGTHKGWALDVRDEIAGILAAVDVVKEIVVTATAPQFRDHQGIELQQTSRGTELVFIDENGDRVVVGVTARDMGTLEFIAARYRQDEATQMLKARSAE